MWTENPDIFCNEYCFQCWPSLWLKQTKSEENWQLQKLHQIFGLIYGALKQEARSASHILNLIGSSSSIWVEDRTFCWTRLHGELQQLWCWNEMIVRNYTCTSCSWCCDIQTKGWVDKDFINKRQKLMQTEVCKLHPSASLLHEWHYIYKAYSCQLS